MRKLLGIAGLCFAASTAHAATKTWAGTGTSPWSTAGNWTPSGVPAATDDVVLPAGAKPTLGSAVTVNSITYTGTAGGGSISANALDGTLTIGAGGITASNTAGFNTIAAPVVLGADQTWTLTVEVDVNGAVNLGAHKLTITNPSNASAFLQGVVSGTGSIDKEGAGELEVTTANGANTFTGGFTVGAGTVLFYGTNVGLPGPVDVAANAVLDTQKGNPFAAAAVVTLDGTLQLSDSDAEFGSLAGAATGAVKLNGHTLKVGTAGGTTIFAGVISSTGGALTTEGSGVLTLTGTSTYTGVTTINAGTLNVVGDISASSAVAVSGGTLSGTGKLPNVSDAGGVVNPGGLKPGTLTMKNFTIGATGVFGPRVEDAGSGMIAATGTITLSGKLKVSASGGFNMGDKLKIIDNQGAGAISGAFTGAAEGATVTSGMDSFTISYKGGDGNDVELTVASAPAPDLAIVADMTELPDMTSESDIGTPDDLATGIPPNGADDMNVSDDGGTTKKKSGGCDMANGSPAAFMVLLVLGALAFASRRRLRT
jgi:MYXO-CTERM domain-containing protein